MGTDTHIKFAGVDGESTHKNHKGEIEVLSWGWEALNDGGGSAGGSGKGKATPGDFHFTHLYDKSSPVLAKNCVLGKHFPKVTVSACKSGGEGQQNFFVMEMSEVFIKSVRPSGSAGGDIVETVTFSYGQIDIGYKAQDDKGTMTGEIKFGWNPKTTVVS